MIHEDENSTCVYHYLGRILRSNIQEKTFRYRAIVWPTLLDNGVWGRTTISIDTWRGVIRRPNDQIVWENLEKSPTPQNQWWVQTSKIIKNDLYYGSQVEKTLPMECFPRKHHTPLDMCRLTCIT